ncbi:hypothetical protein LJC32_01045 [Oscillospiraceae bacterium OttesenSCG-928-F05]|nr:hypothetical protein [Oscillospiraceae bacterium OttesenSCG-928-F05]
MDAMIHSRKGPDTIEEVRKLPGDNEYAVKYKGEWCTAQFNPFSGYYYVDDIYGKMPHFDSLKEQFPEREGLSRQRERDRSKDTPAR